MFSFTQLSEWLVSVFLYRQLLHFLHLPLFVIFYFYVVTVLSNFCEFFSDISYSLSFTLDKKFSPSFSALSYCIFSLFPYSLNFLLSYLGNYRVLIQCFSAFHILSNTLLIRTYLRPSLMSAIAFSPYSSIR